MKFWQLISIMRGHSDALSKVFKEDEWAEYEQWFAKFETLVDTQDRTKLDHDLPDALVARAFEGVDLYVFQSASKLSKAQTGPEDKKLHIAEAYRTFGGSVIEDVFEYGSANI